MFLDKGIAGVHAAVKMLMTNLEIAVSEGYSCRVVAFKEMNMSLTLYLMRHGIAQGGGVPDAERALTDTGRQQVQRLAQELSQSEPTLDLALASPLVRARQTAEIVWREVGGGAPLRTVTALSPSSCASGTADAIGSELLAAPTARAVLVVGHMPVMAELCRLLVANKNQAGSSFAAGEIRRIDFEGLLRPNSGELRFRKCP